MSPKKKNPRNRAQRNGTATSRTAPADPRSPGRPSRTPVVLDDRRRWPLAVWTVLAVAWLGGSALFFVLYLAEGLNLLTSGEVTTEARRATAWHLIWLLVFALGTPLAGAITALVVRRKVAAAMFSAALLISAGALFSLAPPTEMLSAIRGAFG
ncbi:hypothetical protein [Allosalinactinospora lopnorensis]|uniref:hypothetical protein n=1 Tax=Allosalinactinospora lopnorensis TaxID=1352348 RepID=UPI000623D9D2|nr:hypothetical protein [Allosalinactinospora lopnorensis]